MQTTPGPSRLILAFSLLGTMLGTGMAQLNAQPFFAFERVSRNPGDLFQRLPRPNLPDNANLTYGVPPGVSTLISAAIDNYLTKRGLITASTPLAEKHAQRARLVQADRDVVRALAFGTLIGAAYKTVQTTDEREAQQFLSDLMKVRMLVQAGVAYFEYLKWKPSCNAYMAPAGYPAYDFEDDCDGPTGLAQLFWFGPFPPDTKQYGGIAAWGDPSVGTPAALGITASLQQVMTDALQQVLSTVIDPFLDKSALAVKMTKALQPFVLEKLVTGEGAGLGRNATIARTVAPRIVSGPLAIFTFGVSTLIEASIQIADAETKEGKLRSRYDSVKAQTPDVKKLIDTKKGLAQLLNLFVETTVWTDNDGLSPDTYPLPAPGLIEWAKRRRTFRHAEFGAAYTNNVPDAELAVRNWAGANQYVTVLNGWLVVRDDANNLRYTTAVEYTTWDGGQFTLGFSGQMFTHTPRSQGETNVSPLIRASYDGHLRTAWLADGEAPTVPDPLYFVDENRRGSNSISYLTWDGSAWISTWENGAFVHRNVSQSGVSGFLNYQSHDGTNWSVMPLPEANGFIHRKAGASTAHFSTYMWYRDAEGRSVRLVPYWPDKQPAAFTILKSGATFPWLAREFGYRSWDGSSWFASLERGKWIHRNAETNEEHEADILNYIGEDQVPRTVKLSDNLGANFLHYRAGARDPDVVSNIIRLINNRGLVVEVKTILPTPPLQ